VRGRPPVALYVHIPFCLSICPYCDFVVVAGRAARGPAARIEQYVAAVVTEIGLRAAAAPAGRALLDSVYIGGGTPSLLSARQVAAVLDTAERGFGLAAGAEITLEVNPGPADRGDLAGFRAAGVNRLSIGAQSLDAGDLRRLGRRHAPADIGETVRLARRAGFDNVGIDLLYDVPGQTSGTWQRTVAGTLALEPEHVSAYALELADPDSEGMTGTGGDHLPLRPGARRWRLAARGGQDDERAALMYRLADELLGRAGLAWYELSNWARPGRRSRHNRTYWAARAYEAVGPGAHAFDGLSARRWNAARLDDYIAALSAGSLPPGDSEQLDPPTAAAEAAILSLRTVDGLSPALTRSPALSGALGWGRASGLLEATPAGGARLTMNGRLLANELFVRLLPDRHAAVA